jgi:hypothetical protein
MAIRDENKPKTWCSGHRQARSWPTEYPPGMQRMLVNSHSVDQADTSPGEITAPIRLGFRANASTLAAIGALLVLFAPGNVQDPRLGYTPVRAYT